MSAFEKFKRLEVTFNKNYLEKLQKLVDICKDDPDEREQEQYAILETAYGYWFEVFTQNPRSLLACDSFYKAVGENHEMLLARDERLLETDFFNNVFAAKGIDTIFLYESLSDGSDTDNPVENDAKGNLWDVIIGLYRLAVLLCVYLKMPIVKEIIDMILLENPDLTQFNLVEKIFSDFKGKRKLRQLIMKLLKSKTDNFSEIFSSLQRVVASFGSECNLDKNMQQNVDAAKLQLAKMFDDILKKANVTEMKEEDKTKLCEALNTKDDTVKQDFVDRHLLTREQLVTIELEYVAKNLHQSANASKVVTDLGGTMKKMMAAIETGDESQMQKVFEESGGQNMCFNGIDMTKFQGEMKDEFEEELVEMGREDAENEANESVDESESVEESK